MVLCLGSLPFLVTSSNCKLACQRGLNPSMSSNHSSATTSVRKVAIVTGAAQGIGEAIAHRLGRDGYNIALCDLESQSALLEEVCKKLGLENPGGQFECISCDVAREEQVQNLVDTTVEKFGRLDCVSQVVIDYRDKRPSYDRVDGRKRRNQLLRSIGRSSVYQKFLNRYESPTSFLSHTRNFQPCPIDQHRWHPSLLQESSSSDDSLQHTQRSSDRCILRSRSRETRLRVFGSLLCK